jgi:hypothetical protein
MPFMNSASLIPPWLPAAAVLVLGALAVAWAWRSQPAPGRGLRLGGTLLAAVLAAAGTVWQTHEIGVPRNFSTISPGLTLVPTLQAKITSLESQLIRLKHSTTMRTIDPDTAQKLVDYLHGFGSHRVDVACVPNDVEAYDYATQILNVLKAADWDARGPESTMIFGNVQSMGINVYNDAPDDSDTAQILLTGLAKFNIPFQTRVAPNGAGADPVVELFIGAQPILRAATAGDRHPE